MSKEYINRELLENALEDENKNGNFVFTANWIMEIVDNLPTEDVVPKSEVEILKSLITHKEEEAYNKGYSDALKDVEEMITKNISERGK